MNNFEKQKKTIYDLICDDLYVPMKLKEMAMLLQVSKERRQELKDVLDALEEDGKIAVTQKGKYIKAKNKYLTGIFTAHPKGFGFVAVEGQDDDIYISGKNVNGAMHLDEVQVLLMQGGTGKRKEGSIAKVVKRANNRMIGYYESSKNFGFVKPDDTRFGKDIFIPIEHSMGAVAGHKVVVEITDYGSEDKKPEGKVVEIIGHINDPGIDIMSIVKGYDLPVEFPSKVMKQAETVAKSVTTQDMAGRKDLCDWQMVTIDGEDAKDLDDAVSLTMEGENYKLGVHIADVTNYVQEKSALDIEALKRGTSVYLVDRVIPMLPHVLSNGMCSLNHGEKRLALSCIMTIDPKGAIIDHEIAETVINVDERMTYTSVSKILEEHDEEECARYKELVPMFEKMQELSNLLRKRREARGALDFDFPETKVILDEQGKPVEIKPYDRNNATKIIEDFMLAANETVAEDFFWQELPFLYRTHETPDMEKIKRLGIFVNNFGFSLHVSQDEVHPKELQKLILKTIDSPQESLIARLTLRSMKQAKYTIDCTGHFGLAAQYYCHFTSPIRRYPDLQIHRIIKENLRGKLKDKRIDHYEKILPGVAKQTSDLERRAEEAERETIKLKKAEYMADHIGEVFEGVISSVTGHGIYVELPNTIDGLVHISNLKGDYYQFVEDTYELVGETKNRHFKLGDHVKIIVTGADTRTRTIDFELVEDE